MTYTICTQPLTPSLDTLPTYKITDYPLANGAYKPFALAQICVTPTKLVLLLWVYEVTPAPESSLQAVFTTRDTNTLLFADCLSNGDITCYTKTLTGRTDVSINSKKLAGEDQQGFYWGGQVEISLDLLRQIFGADAFTIGTDILGNFYKLSDNEQKPHQGSLHPALFAKNQQYSLQSLGKFSVVAY